MQQHRLCKTRLAPEIERNVFLERFGLESKLPLLPLQIGEQRRLRYALVDLTDAVADDEFVVDHVERNDVAVTQGGQARVAHLGKTRHG